MSVTLSLSIFNNPYWDSVALMLGDLALLVFFVWLIFLMITVGLFVLSVRKKHLYCPWLLRPAYLLLKGAVRTGCRMFGIDDSEIITVMIRLENDVNRNAFAAVPVEERVIFLPHCLRSAKCPAHLTPLGAAAETVPPAGDDRGRLSDGDQAVPGACTKDRYDGDGCCDDVGRLCGDDG